MFKEMEEKYLIESNNLEVGYLHGRSRVSVMKFPYLKVEKGDFIAIAGQNGIGKSTLLKTILQLIPPLSGDILLQGKSVKNYSRERLARHISFVSTETIQVKHLTVKELVAFGRYPYSNWFGQISEKDERMVEKAIQALELEKIARRYVDEISDGERQRAMIAKAIAQETEIIILDEPTAFLDLPHKHEIIHLLGKFSREQQKTILFTTHDLGIAVREADKLWLLSSDGFLEGTPEDLVLKGYFSKVFNTAIVNFDTHKGEFVVKREFCPLFNLKGASPLVYWTQIALEKENFTVLEKEDPSFPFIYTGEAGDDFTWKYSFRGETRTFTSIFELRKFVRHKFLEQKIEMP